MAYLRQTPTLVIVQTQPPSEARFQHAILFAEEGDHVCCSRWCRRTTLHHKLNRKHRCSSTSAPGRSSVGHYVQDISSPTVARPPRTPTSGLQPAPEVRCVKDAPFRVEGSQICKKRTQRRKGRRRRRPGTLSHGPQKSMWVAPSESRTGDVDRAGFGAVSFGSGYWLKRSVRSRTTSAATTDHVLAKDKEPWACTRIWCCRSYAPSCNARRRTVVIGGVDGKHPKPRDNRLA